MKTVGFKKKSISENVLRQSLYWLSSKCDWGLEETKEAWEIHLNCKESEIEKNISFLNRLINDFKLREEIDSKTLNLRQKIITKVLMDLSKDA